MIMPRLLLGKKQGMTQIFDEAGRVVPVTVIEAGPCVVTQVRTAERDGYSAVQIGFDRITRQERAKKPQQDRPYKYFREFQPDKELEVGDTVDVSVFAPGEKVSVSGTSKGKGFQGGVKRHGFSGREATHGVKHDHRKIGSIGVMGVKRVVPGQKMPGHMGQNRVTVDNLEVVSVDTERDVIALKGAVPGSKGSLVEIVSSLTKENAETGT